MKPLASKPVGTLPQDQCFARPGGIGRYGFPQIRPTASMMEPDRPWMPTAGESEVGQVLIVVTAPPRRTSICDVELPPPKMRGSLYQGRQ